MTKLLRLLLIACVVLIFSFCNAKPADLTLSPAVKALIQKKVAKDTQLCLIPSEVQNAASTAGDQWLTIEVDEHTKADLDYLDATSGFMTEKKKEQANDAADKARRVHAQIDEVLAYNGMKDVHYCRTMAGE